MAETEQCPEIYTGSFWAAERCREPADHGTAEHTDTFTYGGEERRAPHGSHVHHTDKYGRTW